MPGVEDVPRAVVETTPTRFSPAPRVVPDVEPVIPHEEQPNVAKIDSC
jgi:hypothetical protein